MDQFIRNPRAGKEDKQLKITVLVFAGFLLSLTAIAGIGQTEDKEYFATEQIQFTQRS
jgi:hypothetical protein